MALLKTKDLGYKYFVLSLLLLVSSCNTIAQQAEVEAIPLPSELAHLPNELTIYSTPNPNIPEYIDNKEKVAWKHSTIIKADQIIRVVESGAYLLYYGNWWKRATFGVKETKELFDSKSLDMRPGDSLTYEKNWRVEPWSRSGWNFWYVKAVNAKGDTLMGYDILYTAGTLEDGTQLLPMLSKTSTIQWTGKGEGDYTLTGTINEFSGRIAYNNGTLSDLSVNINMDSIAHEIPTLIEHLKSKDFFHVSKYSGATFTAESMIQIEGNQWEIEGELCLRGKCNQELWTATVIDTDTTVILNYKTEINRTKYNVNHASTVKPDKNYVILDTIELSGRFEFQKDYPGSNPFNTVEAKD